MVPCMRARCTHPTGRFGSAVLRQETVAESADTMEVDIEEDHDGAAGDSDFEE